MIEMKRQNTGLNLNQSVMNVLELYKINIIQIYSCTSDNGKNMIKLGEIMETFQKEFLLDDNFIETHFEENEFEENDFESSEEMLENNLIQDVDLELNSILTVLKCAVHTLQLAVMDAMKKLNLGGNLNYVRGVIKKLRTPKYRQLHLDNNANKVQLDVPTRWNSIYIMLESLICYKEIYKSLYGSKIHKEIEMTEADWKFVEKYIIAFKPAFIATKQLQSFQLSMRKKSFF